MFQELFVNKHHRLHELKIWLRGSLGLVTDKTKKKNKKIKNKQCREHEQCSAHGCVVKKSRRLVNKQAPSISAFAPLTVTSSIFSCETL